MIAQIVIFCAKYSAFFHKNCAKVLRVENLIKKNRHYFNLNIKFLCIASLDFWKSQFQCTKFIILKRNCLKSQMLWHGRPYGSGSWLPEDKKANMWHGRGKCCGLWSPAFPSSHNKGLKYKNLRQCLGSILFWCGSGFGSRSIFSSADLVKIQ